MNTKIVDFTKEIDLKREFNKLHQKLNLLLEKQIHPTETWVKVSFIQKLTGWDSEMLRRARERKLIRYKKDNTGIFYLLESLNEKFIINKNNQIEK